MRTGGDVTVNATSSNPSESKVNNSGTPAGTTNINASIVITINVEDEDGIAIEGALVYVQDDTGPFNNDEQIIREYTNASGQAQESFAYPGEDVDVVIRVRKKGKIRATTKGILTSSNFTLGVVMYNNPNVE